MFRAVASFDEIDKGYWVPVGSTWEGLSRRPHRAASLALDGIAGPVTRAAFDAYRERAGQDDQAAFESLGLTGPPAGAVVTRLSAGNWFWELGCGSFEPVGIPSSC